jgi:hypothetical protein
VTSARPWDGGLDAGADNTRLSRAHVHNSACARFLEDIYDIRDEARVRTLWSGACSSR